MDQPIPLELEAWFHDRHWNLENTTPWTGGFAAQAIYRLRARAQDGREHDLVYKRLAAERVNEWQLYDLIDAELTAYAPRLVARISEADGCGLLLTDAGAPMKSTFARVDRGEQRRLLMQAVEWLTDMHVRFTNPSRAWLANGRLGPYPIEISLAWVEESLRQVQWAVEHGVSGAETADLTALARQTEWVYPSLEGWMSGPATLTHGDPHMENLLLRDGQFTLIDWEFTCVTIPQRDLAILLQDVLDESLHTEAYETFRQILRHAGWAVDDEAFRVGWLACFFDNTLMMLSWEIFKYREGHLSLEELAMIVPTKLRWMRETAERLRALA